ncbi:MAG: hypothetical protein LCH26_06325 [Proteobacteria bacterium]|nr:hypothetical protein [Pseudomonadota bacterium]
MFTLILPKNRHTYQDKLMRMFAKRRGGTPDVQDTEDSIYIVYEDGARNLYGSCRVNPLGLSMLTTSGLVDRDNCDQLGLLEVSCVSFDEDDVLHADPSKLFLTQWFYSGLLTALENLQVIYNLKGFIALNDPRAHEMCEAFGAWPFEAGFSFPVTEKGAQLYGGFLLCPQKVSSNTHNAASARIA